jgi:hypothetical protein
MTDSYSEGWRRFAWQLVLSAIFWPAIALRSCSGPPPLPTELQPGEAPEPIPENAPVV